MFPLLFSFVNLFCNYSWRSPCSSSPSIHTFSARCHTLGTWHPRLALNSWKLEALLASQSHGCFTNPVVTDKRYWKRNVCSPAKRRKRSEPWGAVPNNMIFQKAKKRKGVFGVIWAMEDLITWRLDVIRCCQPLLGKPLCSQILRPTKKAKTTGMTCRLGIFMDVPHQVILINMLDIKVFMRAKWQLISPCASMRLVELQVQLQDMTRPSNQRRTYAAICCKTIETIHTP